MDYFFKRQHKEQIKKIDFKKIAQLEQPLRKIRKTSNCGFMGVGTYIQSASANLVLALEDTR